jgi:hypothetical protein
LALFKLRQTRISLTFNNTALLTDTRLAHIIILEPSITKVVSFNNFTRFFVLDFTSDGIRAITFPVSNAVQLVTVTAGSIDGSLSTAFVTFVSS